MGGEEEEARSPHMCLARGDYRSGVPGQWQLSCWGFAMKAEGARVEGTGEAVVGVRV